MNKKSENTYKIRIKGLVQGVGFRPFIYRLAMEHDLFGWVENRNDGVVIKVNSSEKGIGDFVGAIESQAPVASNISSINIDLQEHEEFRSFDIVKSKNKSADITDISPDIAVCNDCLEDLKKQVHRLDYPFINCTNCGPRFSIIRDLPYDRHKTTMAPFKMCNICNAEYSNVLDRRFHAQPVACKNCGPQYTLVNGKMEIHDITEILKETARLLKNGKNVAIKGIGGFQIACDALNENAVGRLRKAKIREGKPFAVMFRDLQTLQDFVTAFPQEVASVSSWRRPIVIFSEKKKLAPSVSVGFNTIGAMLPYMPFHYQLFDYLDLPAIVLTSGNLSDEPIVIKNQKALDTLSRITDATVTYNREIHNRTDDSVALVINEKERLIRRSRGYSPEPVNLDLDMEGIVSAGAELVNCFCIGKGKQAIMSQHIGDLKNLETLDFFEESYSRFVNLFRVKPEYIVYDKHPDYLSTRFALDSGLKGIEVQHHHAHIASCMAEHKLDEKVIGVSFDGTGLGLDGNIWGGEFLVADLVDFERYIHFDYLPLPGGDKVTKEPWRTGLSLLYRIYGDGYKELNIPFIKELDPEKSAMIIQAIEKKLNCPLSSSAGRLFDAVAAIMNVCTVSAFHAEAPMRLESATAGGVEQFYPFDFGRTISFDATIEEIIEDIINNTDPGIIAAKFHNTLINVIFAVASQIRKERKINMVVLSGGTFQNRYLSSRVEKKLVVEGFDVFAQEKVPANDGGIALGQIAIAAKRREMGLLE